MTGPKRNERLVNLARFLEDGTVDIIEGCPVPIEVLRHTRLWRPGAKPRKAVGRPRASNRIWQAATVGGWCDKQYRRHKNRGRKKTRKEIEDAAAKKFGLSIWQVRRYWAKHGWWEKRDNKKQVFQWLK